jgi:hypothetical protein
MYGIDGTKYTKHTCKRCNNLELVGNYYNEGTGTTALLCTPCAESYTHHPLWLEDLPDGLVSVWEEQPVEMNRADYAQSYLEDQQ